MSDDLISVVIPVYNAEQNVSECITSLLNQTYQNIEVICVNDGSTDGSADVVHSFSTRDKRVRLIDLPENKGISNALNKGIDAAEGDFIARMDADDWAIPERLKIQKDYMDRYPKLKIVGSWIKLFGDMEQVWHYRQADEFIKALFLFRSNGFPHNSILVRKSLYQEFKYNSAYDSVEDTELWCRIIMSKPDYKFANIPMVLTHYRMHGEQTSSVRKQKQMEIYRKIILGYLDFFCGDVSESDINCHYALIERPTDLTEVELQQVGEWVVKLTKHYNKKFSDAYFAIDEKWFQLCKAQGAMTNPSICRSYSQTQKEFCFL